MVKLTVTNFFSFKGFFNIKCTKFAQKHKNALNIFAENIPVLTYKTAMLAAINTELYAIKSNDILPKIVSATKIDQVLCHNQSETGELSGLLKIKLNAQVILTVNIDLHNRLTYQWSTGFNGTYW